MQVKILSVESTQTPKIFLVQFDSEFGSGQAEWFGDTKPPLVNHSYAIEFEIADTLTWGDQILESHTESIGIVRQDGRQILLGILESIDPDGVVVIRLDPSTLIMLETIGPSPKLGSFVKILPESLVLYPYDEYDEESLMFDASRNWLRSDSSLTSKVGEKIIFRLNNLQPDNLFTQESYIAFLDRAGIHLEEYARLHNLLLKYPIGKARIQAPESKQLIILDYQAQQLRQEYFSRLPLSLFAKCPYCRTTVVQPVDSFSFIGYFPFLNLTGYYERWKWDINQPKTIQCPHWILSMPFVNLHGQIPDDLPSWAIEKDWVSHANRLDAAPYLLVWPLIARQTSAVIHTLPVGRLDDPYPIHRYTTYFVSYFVGPDSNLQTEEMWVPNKFGGPAIGAVMIDDDLLKWVKAGRLFWFDSQDTSRLVNSPVETFPYANIQPKGWYEIKAGGRVDGPKPYTKGAIWEGIPPQHDESYLKTIE